MSSPLKQLLLAAFASVFALQVTASPIDAPTSEYAEHAMSKRATLNIKKTTTTQHHTIDWVAIDSQGTIASPPPLPANFVPSNTSKPVSELMEAGAQLGPSGTVPIPRASAEYLANVAKKTPPQTMEQAAKSKRQDAGDHWYVSSNQAVANYGGSCTFSMFNAFTNNNADFSLLQTAVTKIGTNGGQTLEAGWINYPQQVSAPHIFTYYTTDGYASSGNNIGGWNQDVGGWVQYDATIFPGTVFSPTSTIGGTQYSLNFKYQLYSGNWWLWVLDRWIGYYPASIFSNGISGTTLATGSDQIFYYGEIAQSEGPVTTTDMGSGEFASTGFGQSAFILNMAYYDTSTVQQDYTAGFWDSDASRYSHQTYLSSGGSWGSYTYLGGPGAGGVVNG